MTRRIREAIVGVSAIIVIALGIPLVFFVHRAALDTEVVELQATAAQALSEVAVPLSVRQLRRFGSESDAPPGLGVYAPDHRRVFGVGPSTADGTVLRALDGVPSSETDSAIVVATPIVGVDSERVVGALRVVESLRGAQRRERTVFAIMTAAAIAALGLAWLIGNRLARSLARPLSELATDAAAIGELGVLERRPPSGVAEIDALADTLTSSTRRVSDALARERQFSADVSHQLRTPITSLRLTLERMVDGPSGRDVAPAVRDLERVEATIDHLLAVARDTVEAAGEIRLDSVVSATVERWADAARTRGRHVLAEDLRPTTARVHRASIDEVLDVLIDNALRHGEGDVVVRVREVAGGVSVDVADEGSSIEPLDAERVFTRGHGAGSGLGLSVARAIAEAEGGRLVVSTNSPTTFSLLLLV